MDREAYSLDNGRQRPAYKPKDIHCGGCGAGLTVKDEHAELVICDYCGSHLAVTQVEQKVLGNGSADRQEFPLNLGDSYRRKGHRYEIVARMAFIEDGDYSEMTRQYLLYNPRAGTLWLDEYGGHYSISQATHVMPEMDPFACKRGRILKTHDDRHWVTEETGTCELIYVDGALPWIAKIGDRVAYADFSEKNGSGKQYQAQRIENEVEYSVGRSLEIESVRRATSKPELGKAGGSKNLVDAAVKRKFYITVMLAAVLAILINGALLGLVLTLGKPALMQRFSAGQLNGEVLSKPFRVESSIIKISTRAKPSLSNEWMALNVAIVGSQENVMHVYDGDISYYHGYEGGERWTEGGQTQSAYIKVPRPGTYHLLLHAVSGRGNANRANKTTHGLVVRVIDGAKTPTPFIVALIISGLILVFTIASFTKWKRGDDDDDD